MEYLIIGCGAAGSSAARTIREIDEDSKITMISCEFEPFYIKPTIIDLITSSLRKERVVQKKSELFPEDGIDVITGKKVVDIYPSENIVAFSDGSTLKYSYLLIATGSKPILHPVLCRYPGEVFYVNKLIDAIKLEKESRKAKSALVVGRGRVGLEVVRALYKLGLKITYCVNSTMLWNLDIEGVKGDDIKKKLLSSGIDLRLDLEILDILELDEVNYRVILSDKKTLDCQMIVSAMGLEPNLPFRRGNVIGVDRGILVSEDLRTNISNIFAAGDCAEVHDMKKGDHRINFGWLSAWRQGEIAGKNMAGHEDFFISQEDDAFFLELYGKKILERW